MIFIVPLSSFLTFYWSPRWRTQYTFQRLTFLGLSLQCTLHMLCEGVEGLTRECLRWKYHCTVDLLFDWFGISCLTTDNFCFYLLCRQIQTSQTGVNGTVILPPLVFLGLTHRFTTITLTGSVKANGRKAQSCSGWISYFKLGCFVVMHGLNILRARPHLKLKIRPRFCLPTKECPLLSWRTVDI